MDSAVRVLLLEDVAAGETAERLAAGAERVAVSTAPTVADAVSRVEAGRADCVVGAPSVGERNGRGFLEAVRAVDPVIPVIFYGGSEGVDVGALLADGVAAYVRETDGDDVAVLRNRILSHVDCQRQLGFYETLSEETADVLAVLDDQAIVSYISPSVERVLGHDPDELVGEDPLEYLHPEDCEAVAAAFDSLGEGVECSEQEYRWRGADGSWVWMQTTFRDRRETPVEGYVLTSREIGERKAREQELESRERILEELGDTIYALDEHSEYEYINPAGGRITGYEREEILKQGPELLHPEEDLERFEAVISELAEDDERAVETVEATLLTMDGEEIPIEVSLTALTEDGQFQGTIGVVRVIAERKERERELLEYKTIMQALPDEVAILDTDGYITRAIPATGQDRTSTGYKPEELEGQHVSTVMPDEHLEVGVEKIEELVTTDKERESFEMELVSKDGERLIREDNLALLRDDDGSIQGTVGVLRDIEERKAYEQALEERNERLEEFASIVSHDLRNPLNVAKGRLDLALKEQDSEHLDIAIDSMERMETLIEDLLRLAREGEEVAEIEPVDLEAVSSLSWGHVSAPEASLDVGDLGRIMADESRLQQLLENLYRNAIDHGSEDVSLRVEPIEGGFAVEDDGPGIPPEQRDYVFETGYSGGNGTGFGLAIVERIASGHGWDVDVTAGRDGGARFEITGVERPD